MDEWVDVGALVLPLPVIERLVGGMTALYEVVAAITIDLQEAEDDREKQRIIMKTSIAMIESMQDVWPGPSELARDVGLLSQAYKAAEERRR